MANQPQPTPPRKRPVFVAFVLMIAGLVLLDGAAQSLHRSHNLRQGWILLVTSLALMVLAAMWGSRRI